jgi:hypothetical protein
MEGGYDENGPKRRVLRCLGHMYVFLKYYLILTKVLL